MANDEGPRRRGSARNGAQAEGRRSTRGAVVRLSPRWLLGAVLLGAVSLGGCAVAPVAASDAPDAPMERSVQRPSAAAWLRTELYFAIGRVEGSEAEAEAADAAWRRFLDGEVTPRFPDGFTVHDAYGQWRNEDSGRIGRLRSRVLVILHPDTAEARAIVEDVRSAYRTLTGQDSVLRATHAVEVSF